MASGTVVEVPNVTEPSLYLEGIPHDRFTQLRSIPGLAWHPYLEQTSEPVRARSNFVHGVLSVGMQPAKAS
ncbi:MAG: hypothetical protein OXT07_03575 [bacterium]|nr:hypothetical protein [bacterium]